MYDLTMGIRHFIWLSHQRSKMYDTPKELNEFRKSRKPNCNTICNIRCPDVLERHPQSWCYCVKMSVVLD